jgi:hypothetical protein
VNQVGANELMIITTIYGNAQRMRSYELIAKTFLADGQSVELI